jgi:hypothetical protein
MGYFARLFYKAVTEILNIIGIFSLFIKIGGSSAMIVLTDSLVELPADVRVFALIAIFCGAYILIGILVKLVNKIKHAVNKRIIHRIRKNNQIKTVLNIIEAMDKRIYQLLPEAQRQITQKSDVEKEAIYNTKSILLLAAYSVCSTSNFVKTTSEYLDENGIGLAFVQRDREYEKLKEQLEALLRLNNIKFRNTVYSLLDYIYGINSTILYFRHLFIIKKNMNIITKMRMRRLENSKQQGIGNIMVQAAMKMEANL